MVKKIEITDPTNFEEVVNTCLWWASIYIGGNFGFSLKLGQHLANRGLRYVVDIWDYENNRFRSWDSLKLKYRLRGEDQPCLMAL